MQIIDLKDSTYKDSPAKNGFDSVSKGLVILKTTDVNIMETPYCVKHGAMNKVSADGVWRCPTCNVGCYQNNF